MHGDGGMLSAVLWDAGWRDDVASWALRLLPVLPCKVRGLVFKGWFLLDR